MYNDAKNFSGIIIDMIPYPGLTGLLSKKHMHVSSSYSCNQIELNEDKKFDNMLVKIMTKSNWIMKIRDGE